MNIRSSFRIYARAPVCPVARMHALSEGYSSFVVDPLFALRSHPVPRSRRSHLCVACGQNPISGPTSAMISMISHTHTTLLRAFWTYARTFHRQVDASGGDRREGSSAVSIVDRSLSQTQSPIPSTMRVISMSDHELLTLSRIMSLNCGGVSYS
jgi:hypothetical protein